jgi:ionotropic glutamate receptor NMDA 2B
MEAYILTTSRHTTNSYTNIFKIQVGTWLNKEVIMDDLVWPGKQHKPPLGKPVKFHLKIVTLEEPPFVIYKSLSKDGSCPDNSVLVRIGPKTNL